jgi:site-specific recombinase XerD
VPHGEVCFSTNRNVAFHTFRRALALHLVANNYDPKLAQELLRHSNIRTTLDIYAQAITPKAGSPGNKPRSL